jgi:predicted ATP-dependent endonuclease of OLD family
MRLAKLDISGFRSVAGELSLHIGSALTCLVGANEHGKSNLLDALNLMDGGHFDEHDKYVHSKAKDEPSLTFSVELTDTEKKGIIAALGEQRESFLATAEADAQVRGKAIFDGAIGIAKHPTRLLVKLRLPHNDSRALIVGSWHFPLSPNSPLLSWLKESLPQVRLFEPSDNLSDSISLPELQSKKNLPFVGLLKLADAWDSRAVLFQGDNTAHRHLHAAGKRLTKRVRQIWSQGAAHTFRFDENAGKLHVSIEDPTTFDMPSRRSLGFQSFLAFYLSVYAETDDIDPHGFILLFDEPGIHLHPRGQKDLLRELRRLAEKNQIVYTTHSPFMIDRNNPLNTVLVRKGLSGPLKGTRIVAKPYGQNWGPLNRELGITPADGFFPADRILLVEGRSDRLYIQHYMTLSQPMTRADLNDFAIVDCERREEVEDYVKLLLASDRKVVVLADGDQGGDELGRRIKRIAGKKKDQVTFVDLRQLLSANKDVSLEDALPAEAWFAAVQEYVTQVLKSSHQIVTKDISTAAETRSLGRAAGEYLVNRNVLKSSRSFSKTTVADFFCRTKTDIPDRESALVRLCLAITSALGIHL